MIAFNPLESVERLEAAGIPRPHAEAIAAEINAAKTDLAAKLHREQREAALDRTAIRLCILTLALASLVCAVLGPAL